MSNVREFGARGDGRIDDTDSVLHAVENGDGLLHFPPGDYLLTRTITVDLAKTGRFGLEGSGGTAKIIMAGSGPAFHLIGTHEKTADPGDFAPEVWQRQRMPTVMNVEIEGRHPNASGFCVEAAMQATFEGVLLRELEHGILVRRRARNLLISHCHIYNNRGVGVFLDGVNLHQAVAVALTAPSNTSELVENLELLRDWRGLEPGQREELSAHGERIRRHAGSFP